MNKQTLFSFELEPGMITYEDVLDSSGRLIIPKDTVLDEDIIYKLDFFSILELIVYNEEPSSQDSKDSISTESIKFSRDYDSFLKNIKTNLNSFVSDQNAITEKELIKPIFSLIDDCKNTIQLFDILHNLKNTVEPVYHHSLNVSIISVVLGSWLHLSQSDLEQLALAGILHDIGKTIIPPQILNKTSKLTDEELQIVHSHVTLGYNIIKELDLDPRIKEACLLHHERCDGSGYPNHYTLSKIPTFAKIISIADVYEAMTSQRSYRKEFCTFDVIRIFDAEGLNKYDPKYIMTFLENIVSAYLHNNVILSDGRKGSIVMINKSCLYRPVVQCGDNFIDLSKNTNLKIKSVL